MPTDGKRTLLVVSGGGEALAGIRRARELGLHVVVSDGDPAAPGLAAAHEGLLADTYDIPATVAAARRYHRQVRPIDGVLSIASDVPLTVASVAAALDLPGISLAAARLSADKLAMKRRLAEHGVAVPAFAPTPTPAHLRAFLAGHGYPIVVKPIDSRGARGVLLLRDDRVDLDWAHATARRESPTGRVMAERFLDGPQLSTESLLFAGRAHTVGVADRNYEHLQRFAPFVIENGGELPSHISPSERAAVGDVLQRSAFALGAHTGVLKGDIVLHNGVPSVIEVALRLSGGYLATHEIPLATGVDFIGLAIGLALGTTPSPDALHPTRNRGVAQRWLFPTPGRVLRVQGADAVAARPNIALCEVRVAPGDLLPPLSSHRSRAGLVIATGATRSEAVSHARRAISDIEITTDAEGATKVAVV